MRALLLYPQFPKSFWSYERVLQMAGLKTLLPPLGMITVAALLPKDWELRFYDRNVGLESDADWAWCDIVILSSMLVQRPDFHALIQKALHLGKKVAVGGPYPSAMPQALLDAGVHYLVLDEGELTLPPFLEALERGDETGVFRSEEKPDVAMSPVPRFDLLKQDAYFMMSVQFSRGCPFSCEFCDIITLYGKKPRTKGPEQTLAELQALYELGWRGPVFIVDDNFIGNKREVKRFLRELIPWMEARGHPFTFKTEASVNLAEDDELMSLMTQAGFYAVFLGIETPDQDSLQVTKKLQNTRHPFTEACQKINTALWHRLRKENRLVENANGKEVGDENRLMNFVPTRPVVEIAQEYVDAFWNLYEPSLFLSRSFRQCFRLGLHQKRGKASRSSLTRGLRIVVQLVWAQGIRRPGIRLQFWRQLFLILIRRPQVLNMYLGFCAAGEHFWDFRVAARDKVTRQIAQESAEPSRASDLSAAS